MKGSIKIGEVCRLDGENGLFDVVFPDEDDVIVFNVSCAGEGCCMPKLKQLVLVGFPDNDSSNGVMLGKPFQGLHKWKGSSSTYYQDFPGGGSIFVKGGIITIDADKMIINGDLEVNGDLHVNGRLTTKE